MPTTSCVSTPRGMMRHEFTKELRRHITSCCQFHCLIVACSRIFHVLHGLLHLGHGSSPRNAWRAQGCSSAFGSRSCSMGEYHELPVVSSKQTPVTSIRRRP